MKNPWTRTKKVYKWKTQAGDYGSLYELGESDRLTEDDVKEAKQTPEDVKYKVRAQYILDKQEEENNSLPTSGSRKYRKYSL